LAPPILSCIQTGSEQVLEEYIQDLILSAPSEKEPSRSIRLAAKLALARPNILHRVIVQLKRAVSVLICRALLAHVSSDEAFEIDPREFISQYYAQSFQDDGCADIHERVMVYLKFLEMLLLVAGNDGGVIPSEEQDLLRLMFLLVGLRDREVAELASRITGLFIEHLDIRLKEGSSEVSSFPIDYRMIIIIMILAPIDGLDRHPPPS
jgi:hypothetical protein